MSKTKIFLTFLSLSCQLLFSANAATFDREYIENYAKQAVENSFVHDSDKKITITPATLDPRLTIQPCDEQLQANIPENIHSRNVNVKISCEGSIPWNIYVPVKVEVNVPVIVATQTIAKGSMLTEENVSLAYIAEYKVRGEVVEQLNSILHAKAKRNISQGKPINRKHICLVCKGDVITIEAASTSLSIKTSGTSLGYGHLGDKIRVRNNSSGKSVTGVVSGLNKVSINL